MPGGFGPANLDRARLIFYYNTRKSGIQMFHQKNYPVRSVKTSKGYGKSRLRFFPSRLLYFFQIFAMIVPEREIRRHDARWR